MRSVFKYSSITIAAFTVLIVLAGTYSTVCGYTRWWFPSRGAVQVDGKAGGYLHKNRPGTALILTRTDLEPAESYMVTLAGSPRLNACGDLRPPKFLPFAIGDVNPPCLGFVDGYSTEKDDSPKISTLSIQPHRIEFSTEHGKHVTASW